MAASPVLDHAQPTLVRSSGTSCFPAPVPDWSARIPALDGLRGLAILLVLLRHTVFGMETQSRALSIFLAAGQISWSGVDLFFVLSGFLIGGILLDARNSRNYFKTFYVRRAFRIFPLYFAVASFFLFRHLPFRILPGSLGDHSQLTIPWYAYFTLTQNFWMVPLGWFGPGAMTPTWSLAVEEQFYLAVPWLIQKIRVQLLPIVLGAVIVGALVLRIVLRYVLPHGDFACYVLMPCRADALCMGVLIAYLVRRGVVWSWIREHIRLFYLAAIALFVGVEWMSFRHQSPFASPTNTWGYSWIGLFYGVCLIIAISSRARLVTAVLCNKALMSLGTVAYCAYLTHEPLVLAGRRLAETLFRHSSNYTWLVGGLVGLVFTLSFAALSWRFYEKPLLQRGRQYRY